ncbi:hypothetical protein J6590_065610 [Homalodisca vitripennis]|nr:hypothetical protein J6590_065610 [Homalodisca vitripennis]
MDSFSLSRRIHYTKLQKTSEKRLSLSNNLKGVLNYCNCQPQEKQREAARVKLAYLAMGSWKSLPEEIHKKKMFNTNSLHRFDIRDLVTQNVLIVSCGAKFTALRCFRHGPNARRINRELIRVNVKIKFLCGLDVSDVETMKEFQEPVRTSLQHCTKQKVNGKRSLIIDVNQGVPQGSILKLMGSWKSLPEEIHKKKMFNTNSLHRFDIRDLVTQNVLIVSCGAKFTALRCFRHGPNARRINRELIRVNVKIKFLCGLDVSDVETMKEFQEPVRTSLQHCTKQKVNGKRSLIIDVNQGVPQGSILKLNKNFSSIVRLWLLFAFTVGITFASTLQFPTLVSKSLGVSTAGYTGNIHTLPAYQSEVAGSQSEVTGTQSEVPESQSEVPESQSEVPESQSEVPESQSDVTESQPEVLEPQSEVSESQSEVPEPQPEVPESQLEVPESQPEVPESQPEVPESQPEVLEPQSEVSESQSKVPESQPEVPESQSDVTKTNIKLRSR